MQPQYLPELRFRDNLLMGQQVLGHDTARVVQDLSQSVIASCLHREYSETVR